MQPLNADHPLHRMFSGAVQQALFVEVGICDTQLADYLADMLSSLIHINELYPYQNASGQRLISLAEWVTDAQLKQSVSDKQRQRVIHQHIGDFTLFWTGLFPEGLRRLEHGVGSRVTDYLQQGKRSYSIASELTGDEDRPPASVLHRLSEQYEVCMLGLNLCRKDWSGLTPRLPSA